MRIALLLLCLSNLLYSQNSIYELIADSDEHTILEEFINITEFQDILKDDFGYSLLAPNDAAFHFTYSDHQLDSLRMNVDNCLTDLIHFHIITNDTTDLPSAESINTLYGKSLFTFVDKSGIQIIVGGASPYPTFPYNEDPITATNGRVYFLEGGLLNLPTTSFYDLVSYNSFFSNSMGQLDYIEDFLFTEDLYTAFLPPQDSIYNSELYMSGALNDLDTLDSFLSKHIIKGHYTIDELYDGLELETYNGGHVSIYEIDDTLYVEDAKIISQCPSTKGVAIFIESYITERTISNTKEHLTSSILIYPNPATNLLKIYSQDVLSNTLLEIIDLKGVSVKSKILHNGINTIHLDNLLAGYYLVKHTNASGYSSFRKVIIH